MKIQYCEILAEIVGSHCIGTSVPRALLVARQGYGERAVQGVIDRVGGLSNLYEICETESKKYWGES